MISFLFPLCLLALARWLYLRRSSKSSAPLPPGPPKLPLIGNVLSIPSSHQWIAFSQWAKHYGSDVIQLDVLGKSIVILDSYSAATDLLDKRSLTYSNRPDLIMAANLMGWENSIFFQPYGNTWRTGRRMLHEQFHPAAASRFRPQQTATAHRLLLRLLESPADFREHVRRVAGSLSMSITYGLETQPRDPLIDDAAAVIDAVVTAATPGSFLVDFLPILKHVPAWFPGADFQRQARKWKQDTAEMQDRPFQITKRAVVDGLAPPSFARHGLEAINKDADVESQEEMIKWRATDIYAGGADTSVSSILSFILGILSNPQAMRAAQAEIDAVVKPGFLPTFEDEENLPYVSAIVRETLRWNNVTPLAVPHSATKEDIYKDFRIPAGSIVVPNVWAMAHDEDEYPDSFKFKPERFLKDGKLNPDVRDPRSFVFGFGRRICPGLHLAYSFLWIVVASVLSTLDITKAVDENGQIVEPSYEYSSGLVTFALPFRCSIEPRTAEKAQMIKAAVEAAS